MTEKRWNDLCTEGIRTASGAYEKAIFDSAEEKLAKCFRILFTLLKESWKDDCQIKESINKESININ